ncbi:hypothetical protein BH23BAC3_BH23BAC3_21390 [soil metagenome]
MTEIQFCFFILNEIGLYDLPIQLFLIVLVVVLSLNLFFYIKKRKRQGDLYFSEADQSAFLKSILDHSGTGNAILDSDGFIRYVNFGFLAHFNKDQVPLVGKNIKDLPQLGNLERSFNKENSTVVEMAGKDDDPYLIKYFTVNDASQKIIGRFLKMLPIINENDDTAGIDISHELKTPLHAVLGFSHLLQKDNDLTSDQQKLLEKIIYHSKLLDGKIKHLVGAEEDTNEPAPAKVPVKKILVVDDVSINRTLLKLMLKRYGLDVQEASNGEAALKILEKWKADTILLDLSMPVMDGIETVKLIRGNNSGNKNGTSGTSGLTFSKIIAVTATQRYSREELMEIGFDDLMHKPFKEEELLSRLGIQISN